MSTSDVRSRLEAIAGPVSRETWDSLLAYERLFHQWSKAINLASPATLDQFWDRHVLDSAQLLPLSRGAKRWADLGSGGGLPGLVVAILLREVPDSSVCMIESKRKKAAFLQTVSAELALPVQVFAQRISEVVPRLEVPEVVTARALAPLGELLELTEPWLSTSARSLFHKGRDYQREVAETAQHWRYDLIEHPSAVASDGVILEIAKLRRRS